MPDEMNHTPETKQGDFESSDTPEEISNPQTNQEVYNGSFAGILGQNTGFYVVVEFLVGTNRLETKEGILFSVGINFITLYDIVHDRYIVCDLYAIKFVTFYNTTDVPPDRRAVYDDTPQNDSQTTEAASRTPRQEARTVSSTNYPPSQAPYPSMRSRSRRMF